MPRPVPHPLARRAAAAVAALALLTGCSGNALDSDGATDPSDGTPSGPTAPTTATTPPARPAPVAGACRQLTYSTISRYSNTTPSVACTKPHTATTFAVRRLPATVDVVGVSIGNKSVQQAASKVCRDAYTTFIGGDPVRRALSRLSVTYFLPMQLEFNRGAHWVRCDVVALATPNSLAELPDGDLEGFLDKPAALEQYGVCSAGPPGETSSVLVMCAGDHTYRALTALRLGTDETRYPGERVTRTQGQQRCATYIANKLGSAGGYTYGWTYPTPADWATGQRFGYCWHKSTR